MLSSYVVVDAKGANEAFLVWTLQVMDETGKTQSFGPYTQESVSIPSQSGFEIAQKGRLPVITMMGQSKAEKLLVKKLKHVVA
jgi:hypothetical protein